jgi:hypothetical protein
VKLFNIDLHISVITDLKNIFSQLGHTVIDKSLSGHTWVLNRKQDTIKLINPNNWRQLDRNFCDKFYKEYRSELANYDGFVCTYPPSFALLYGQFNKPIILQVPIRFEVPFENRPTELKWFIDFLKSGIDNGQIIPVCNNLYDKKYCEKYTEREWILIPNICDYTGIKYEGGSNYLFHSKLPIDLKNSDIKYKNDYLGHNYKWKSLNTIRGIIHLPYNISTMSIFEQYTGNIPLFFPTPEFNLELYKTGLALTELSWSSKKEDSIDWINLADYYNQEWMPYITYFSSWDEMNNIVKKTDVLSVSEKMKIFNVDRKKNIYNKWSKILNDGRFSK